MTDSAAGSGAPPKKKFAFKKAAWQTAPKAEENAQVDMFSHSNEFRDIVAEQARRKQEEKKKKAEEARKRNVPEEHERKRRKSSIEAESAPGSGPASSASDIRPKQAPSSPSLSPSRLRSRDTLSRRYDSLTKTPSTGSFVPSQPTVIDLGDSDEDDSLYHKASSPAVTRSTPAIVPIRSPSEEMEEVEDPEEAAFRAAARARAAEKRAAEKAAQGAQASGPASKAPAVQLLITSYLPETKPLMLKVRIDQTIETARKAWCGRQGFSPAQTNELFLTYRDRRLYDSTTIQLLGIKVDEHGNITVPGDTTMYDEIQGPKIHVLAWTPSFKEQYDKEVAEEEAAQKKATEVRSIYKDPTPEPEPEPETTFKVVLLERGQKETGVGLTVRPDTDFGHLASAYKQKRGIAEDRPITLIWDGDRLSPMDTIGDTDLEDMDVIEVHFK